MSTRISEGLLARLNALDKKLSRDPENFINICGHLLIRRKDICQIKLNENPGADFFSVFVYRTPTDFFELVVPKILGDSIEKLFKDLT